MTLFMRQSTGDWWTIKQAGAEMTAPKWPAPKRPDAEMAGAEMEATNLLENVPKGQKKEKILVWTVAKLEKKVDVLTSIKCTEMCDPTARAGNISTSSSLGIILLKGFLGGAEAVPTLANVGVGVTIPTTAQQKYRIRDPWIGYNIMGGMLQHGPGPDVHTYHDIG
uniref:Uncharacterized protein n=1 Tax=Romanomermis culicivorax TaxID=13658 RepID=A0A915IS01_ROMCU